MRIYIYLNTIRYIAVTSRPQCTYIIPGVPQCLSPLPNWDQPTTLSRKRVCPPPPRTKRGGDRLGRGVREWGSPNSDDWKKSLALCLLCVCSAVPLSCNTQNVNMLTAVKAIYRSKSIFSWLSSYLGPFPPSPLCWDRRTLPATQRKERVRERANVESHTARDLGGGGW